MQHLCWFKHSLNNPSDAYNRIFNRTLMSQFSRIGVAKFFFFSPLLNCQSVCVWAPCSQSPHMLCNKYSSSPQPIVTNVVSSHIFHDCFTILFPPLWCEMPKQVEICWQEKPARHFPPAAVFPVIKGARWAVVVSRCAFVWYFPVRLASKDVNGTGFLPKSK